MAVAVLAAAPAASDATRTARERFDDAREAFERNDLEHALREFEAARAAGLSGPAVDYNIGVAAYRLERFEVADEAFRRVARVPEMAPLAHYNLGLVALRRGELEEAAHFFRLASEDAGHPDLRDLADAQLARLQPAQPPAIVARFASLGIGYDGNVALVSDADLIDASGVDDAFVQAQLAIVGPLDRPLRFEAAALHTDYASLDRYDELTLGLGARYLWSGTPWSHEAGANAAYATLDTEGFERRGTIALQTERELSRDWAVSLRYRLSEVDGLQDFEGLTGTRHYGAVRAERRAGQGVARLEYGYETSDLADPLLSSDRHVLGAELRSTPRRGWELAGDISYRRADYGEEGASRDEHQGTLALEAVRSLGGYWRVVVRYEYLINESSDAQFDFERSRASMGLAAFW